MSNPPNLIMLTVLYGPPAERRIKYEKMRCRELLRKCCPGVIRNDVISSAVEVNKIIPHVDNFGINNSYTYH